MMTDVCFRRPLWIGVATLVAIAAAVASDTGAQGADDADRRAITADFALLPSGVSVPPAFQIAGMTFFAHSSPDALGPRIVDWGPPHERSYGFPDEGVTVVLPLEAQAVKARLCIFAGPVLVEAYSSRGNRVTQQEALFDNACGELLLKGAPAADLISIVRFTGGSNEASIALLSAILNTAPVAYAGEDQVVIAGESVFLQSSAWDPGQHHGANCRGNVPQCRECRAGLSSAKNGSRRAARRCRWSGSLTAPFACSPPPTCRRRRR